MAERRFSETTLMWVTLLLAVVLTLLPLSDTVRALWPNWMAMLIIYWVLEGNRLRLLGQAAVLGLLLDLATGTLLGQHMLGLVVLSFILFRSRHRLRFYPPWQQAAAVMMLLYAERVVTWPALTLTGEPTPTLYWWLAPLIGLVIWPWLFLAMDWVRQTRRLTP